MTTIPLTNFSLKMQFNICHEPQSVSDSLGSSRRAEGVVSRLPVMRGARDRGLEQLLAPCTQLFNANRHPVAMVIYSLSFHCAKYFISHRNVFFTLYVTVLTLIQYHSLVFLHLIFVTFSFMKVTISDRKKKFSIYC